MNMQSTEQQSIKQELVDAIHESITTLSQMMQERLPGIVDECRKINDFLRQEPRAAALLTPEEIGIFMQSHFKLAQIEFSAPKGGVASKANVKKLAAQEISPDQIII